MHSDDVYRSRLEDTIAELQRFGAELADCAEVRTTSAPGFYWKMSVNPHFSSACPFQILLLATPHFSLDIAGEVYEDKPLDRFEFFPMLARAITGGHVERHETVSALTGALEMIESRVELEDGWVWIGERRTGARGVKKLEAAQEKRIKRFLPYRRSR